MCRGQIIVGSDESHMCDAGPSQKVFFYLPLIGRPLRILEQHTNVCAVCVRVRSQTLPPSAERLADWLLPAFRHGINSRQSVVKKLCPGAIGSWLAGPALRLRR